MKLSKLAGATSEIWQVFIADSSSTTGAGLTGLLFNTASLTAYYHRDTDTTATAITLVTMTVGTFTSSGFKEIDATNMPGWYQFCPPNAAIASGAKSCAFHLKGATNMAPLPIEVQLTAVNPDSATAFITSVATVAAVTGLTASDVGAIKTKTDFLPSATAGAAGGVFIAGTNAATTVTTSFTTTFTGNLTGSVASVTGAVGSVTGAVGSVTGAVGSVTGNLGGNVVGSVGSVTGAVGSVTGAVGSVTGNVGGNVVGTVGSVVGAVGSVTGAVGSVTGNVGGNVVGSVASVTAAVTVSGDLSATMKTSVQTASAAALTACSITSSGIGKIAGVTLTTSGTGGQSVGA